MSQLLTLAGCGLMPGRAIRKPDSAFTRWRPMAAGDLNLIVRGLWLYGSHWQFSFRQWPASRRRFRYGLCVCASEVASVGLFSSGHFCFAALLDLFFEPLLYCDQVLFGVG